MSDGLVKLLICVSLTAIPATAQERGLNVPATVVAGSEFSIRTAGSGKAILYVVGPGQAVKRLTQLGDTVTITQGTICNAGRYAVVLTSQNWTQTDAFDVTPAAQPASLSFLARPSRLPVNQHDGITGAVYVYDAYRNLITVPTAVSFELTDPTGAVQTRTAMTRQGAAWIAIDSTARQGSDKFVARAGGVSSARVVRQVPGDPCSLVMTAERSAQHIELETQPVRDCSGNAVPDGTIVTFTETYKGMQSTVDVPLKRGVAKVEMPAELGATISVASGVVMGNQLRWER